MGGKNKPVMLGTDVSTPPDNVGPRTTPNYDSLAAAAVTNLGGGVKVFAGQRDDPFYVDLGSIFDLGGLRPFNPFHLHPARSRRPGVDALTNYNTHSIELQVPISQLTDVEHPTIGIYASASREKETVLKNDGTKDGHGPWVQVSRLGNPLINEVIIPLGQKDYWNRSEPEDDAQFEDRYTSPELAGVINLLYGAPPPPGHPGGALQHVDTTGRSDLKAVLLTGVPGLNFTGDTDADLLRLNTAIKPGADGACPGGTASPAPQDRLGGARRRLLRVPERPASRRRRHRHRAPRGRAGLRADPGRRPRPAGQEPERSRRRRRRRERRAVLEHVPVRRVPAPGLRGPLSGST